MTAAEKTKLIKELRKVIQASKGLHLELEKEAVKALTKILNIV